MSAEKQNLTEKIVKDISEITFRLFVHRPFLDGEISFFLSEFEGIRRDSEVENLFTTVQRISETKFNTNKCKTLAENNLTSLKTNLASILSTASEILSIEKNQTLDAVLEKNRLTRKKLWDDFVIDENYKKDRIDYTFEQKKEDLCEFYSDLEQKLHIHS